MESEQQISSEKPKDNQADTSVKTVKPIDTEKRKKMFCSTTCQRICIFSTSLLLLIFGLVLVLSWGSIYRAVIKSELSLQSRDTKQFKFWMETPIPMFFEIYLFNWTNAEKFKENQPWTEKPEFEELGPYTFQEYHTRANVKFNNNNTVSFNTVRTWRFVPNKTRGSLDDKITTVNTIALTVGNIVQNKPYLMKRGVSFLLEEKRINLTVTHTAREFLFDGYDDKLLNLLKKLHLKGIDIPFDKFGWFYNRNGSSTYDGNYTMNTGEDDIQKLGIVTRWNQSPTVPEYPGYCGMINGTTGEVWYPLRDSQSISIFTPDTCSTLTLEANGTYSNYGLEGTIYAQTDKLFDNGTKYPDMGCFSPGVRLPSGVRNVSQCKFGAPAFMSMPHFYNADPSYVEAVKGMHPDPSKHTFYLALEPETGLPLKVQASLQVSLYLNKITGISMFEHVTPTMMPVLWFRQRTEITEKLAGLAKTLLILPDIGSFTGYGIIGIGSLLLLIGFFITVRNGWRGTEDEEPLTQNHI